MSVEKQAWWEKARAYAGGGVGAQARRRARKDEGASGDAVGYSQAPRSVDSAAAMRSQVCK